MRRNHIPIYLAMVFTMMFVRGLMAGGPAGKGVEGTSMAAGNEDREPFFGTWSLVSYEIRRPDGTVTYPFGQEPKGQIMYDKTGHMSAQLMNPDRPNFRSGQRGVYTEEEIRAAWTGYVGYAGTFSVDVKAGIVTHHVNVAAFPNWVGSEQVRSYVFSDDGNQLLLSAPTGPGGTRAYLLWARAEKDESRFNSR